MSWAKLTPRTIQSGSSIRMGRTGKGNRYLRRILATAAAAAGRTHTFIGARHRRIKRRRGTLKALVATSRAILEIIWRLLSNPAVPRARRGPLRPPGRPRAPQPCRRPPAEEPRYLPRGSRRPRRRRLTRAPPARRSPQHAGGSQTSSTARQRKGRLTAAPHPPPSHAPAAKCPGRREPATLRWVFQSGHGALLRLEPIMDPCPSRTVAVRGPARYESTQPGRRMSAVAAVPV